MGRGSRGASPAPELRGRAAAGEVAFGTRAAARRKSRGAETWGFTGREIREARGSAGLLVPGAAARSHAARPGGAGHRGEARAGGWRARPPQSRWASEAGRPFRIDSPRWMVNDCFPGLIKLSSSGLLLLRRGGGAFPTCAAASDCGPGEGRVRLRPGFASRPALALDINPAAWQLCGEDLGGGRLFSLGHLKCGVVKVSPSRALSSSLRPWMLEERLAGVFPTSVVVFETGRVPPPSPLFL